MKKEEFLKELRKSLNQFPDEEVKDIISYYDEMIGDKTEQGISEEKVIESLGDIRLISARIKSDLVDVRLKEPKKNIVKTSNNFFIVLMLCASPALIPLGIAFFAVFFSLFITVAALAFSFGATALSLIIALIPGAIITGTNLGAGAALLASGVILILIGVFTLLTVAVSFIGVNLLNGVIKFTNKTVKKFNKRGQENVNN